MQENSCFQLMYFGTSVLPRMQARYWPVLYLSSVFQCYDCNTCLTWSFTSAWAVGLHRVLVRLVVWLLNWQLVCKSNRDIMIFVKAVTGNVVPVFEIILWCYCWPLPSSFYTPVHFESCARQVWNIKMEDFGEHCLKVFFSDSAKS